MAAEGDRAVHAMTELYETLENTHDAAGDETFAKSAACSCSPSWPGLETTANGYVLRAVPSSHYSIMTDPEVGTFVARCSGCYARYPEPWVMDKKERMPYAWARERDERPRRRNRWGRLWAVRRRSTLTDNDN
ncbi:hypothetical protein [Streptomyces sp. NPDC002619]|uniref:hypothetical protein n=1 Tax=Streptomyces sp. NPDC002619 TaxID=3364655 RepID=UPI0036B7ADF2